MQRWLKLGVIAAAGVAASGALAVVAAGLAWRRATEQRVTQLTARRQRRRLPRDSDLEAFSRASLEGLPPPVMRYFAFALMEGQPRIRAARIRWTGEFQSRPGGGWSPFEAEQHFSASPPGFVWDARIRMMPLLAVRVRDSYVGGTATMLGRMAGLVPVVDQGGTPEIAAGALVRWLGEAVWFPTALLPASTGEGVRWEPIDDGTARATVTDGATTVSAVFHFAPGGEIVRMTALRYRDLNGTAVLTPFDGTYGDYAPREGVMIPMSAEVGWSLLEGRYPYWRGRPVGLVYEFVATPP